jgi:hypothetical protein
MAISECLWKRTFLHFPSKQHIPNQLCFERPIYVCMISVGAGSNCFRNRKSKLFTVAVVSFNVIGLSLSLKHMRDLGAEFIV